MLKDRDHMWREVIEKNIGHETQQGSVRTPSSAGVSVTDHAMAVQVQGARKLPWFKSFLSHKNIISGNDATDTPPQGPSKGHATL